MTRLMNILASAALAASLAPVAANAATTAAQNPTQFIQNAAAAEPLPAVQHVTRDFDALQIHAPLNQPVVHSGAEALMFPQSVGG
jgi:hypothetical protein